MITLLRIGTCVLMAALAAVVMELIDVTVLDSPIIEERSTPIYIVRRLYND